MGTRRHGQGVELPPPPEFAKYICVRRERAEGEGREEGRKGLALPSKKSCGRPCMGERTPHPGAHAKARPDRKELTSDRTHRESSYLLGGMDE
jgi:hypothetical protein